MSGAPDTKYFKFEFTYKEKEKKIASNYLYLEIYCIKISLTPKRRLLYNLCVYICDIIFKFES